jgi:phospholipid transport system substrate-binding protein
MMLDRRALLAGAAALALAAPARAATEAEAETFIRALVEEMETILETATPSNPQTDRFLDLLRRRAALPQIGQFTMGLAWRSMSEAQKARFQQAFERYAARAYADNFTLYEDQEIVVSGAQDLGRKGVVVRSLLKQPNAEDIRVDWLVTDRGGPIAVADVTAEGVSLSISQREQFAAMLEERGGDIDAFLGDLEGLTLDVSG